MAKNSSLTVGKLLYLLVAVVMCIGMFIAVFRLPFISISLSAPVVGVEKRDYTIAEIKQNFGVEREATEQDEEYLARILWNAETDKEVVKYAILTYYAGIALLVLSSLVVLYAFVYLFSRKKPLIWLIGFTSVLLVILASLMWWGGDKATESIKASVADYVTSTNTVLGFLNALLNGALPEVTVTASGYYWAFCVISSLSFLGLPLLGIKNKIKQID